jgi:Family of unknown function (DUF5686)/CarboxypepD_reg-like domain
VLAQVSPPASTPASKIQLSGRVLDTESQEPVPFAMVFVPGSNVGTTSDVDGHYRLAVPAGTDSVVATAMNYRRLARAVKAARAGQLDFVMKEAGVALDEVVIRPGENPAWAIMRQVIAHKDQNSPKSLTAYEVDAYTKIEADLTNMSPKLAKRKLVRAVQSVADSLGVGKDDEGRAQVPVFLSETSSRLFIRKSPDRRREEIKRTRVSGVGFEEGSVVQQFVGSSFQEYNLYDNFLNALGKDCPSPLADGWKLFYNYDLMDSVMVGSDFCYQIAVTPKVKQSAAFRGTIWITKKEYALRRTALEIGREADINFVDKLTFSQESMPTGAGPWLPLKTRILVRFVPAGDKLAGMQAKFYVANSNPLVNQPRAGSYYDQGLVAVAEDASSAGRDESYWQAARPDSLTPQEQAVTVMIDSVQKLPIVRTYVEVADLLINGYKKIGKIDFGPLPYLYAHNNIEGNRFRVGFRTNDDFSRSWLVRGSVAYGTLDNRFKYNAEISRVFDRRTWTVGGVGRRQDLELVVLVDNDVEDNVLFELSTRWGNLSPRRPFMRQLNWGWLQRDLFRGFTQKVVFRTQGFDPLYRFAYLTGGQTPDGNPEQAETFQASELILESSWTKDVEYLSSGSRRFVANTPKWPTIRVRYTAGFDQLFKSDFKYQKWNLNIKHTIGMGLLGRGTYVIDAGYIPSTVPYPVLKTHLGNETPFLIRSSFNLMRNFEFVSDTYASLSYEQHFEGLGLNRIPGIKKLKWRLVGGVNILEGSVRAENRALIPATTPGGEPIPAFRSLEREPYTEVSYGIENIFRLIRVDAIHRLNYRNLPGAPSFGVKATVQFKL